MTAKDDGQEIENPYHFTSSVEPEPPPADDHEAGPFKPFKTIWIHPRTTIRRIIAVDPKHHLILLACLSGVAGTFDRASMRNLGDHIPLAGIIAVACLFGPLGGLLGLWIGSRLIRFTGSWIGGKGMTEHLEAAIAWAAVPAVFALPLWIPQILLFGSELFTEEMPRVGTDPVLMIAYIVFGMVEFILGIWNFILLCNTVAEVQGFRSAWRGFGNIILAGLLVGIPLFLILLALILPHV
jgi:hypothetical protein